MQYFAHLRLYEPTEEYREHFITLAARDFPEAVALVEAWRAGIESVSDLKVLLEGVTTNRTRGKNYTALWTKVGGHHA